MGHLEYPCISLASSFHIKFKFLNDYWMFPLKTDLYLVQHLKEDMKLSYLAQELISTDRLAPQSW